MQFLFSPIIGALSDRFGRRPVLLIALLGLGIDYIFMAYAPTIAWLFIGRIIAGISGASISTATAYIADISTPEKLKEYSIQNRIGKDTNYVKEAVVPPTKITIE